MCRFWLTAGAEPAPALPARLELPAGGAAIPDRGVMFVVDAGEQRWPGAILTPDGAVHVPDGSISEPAMALPFHRR